MNTTQLFPATFFSLKDLLNSIGNDTCHAKSVPASFAQEKENAYELEVELPGVRKEDIEIHFENKVLSVSAIRKRGEAEWKFKRDFRVSENVDTENVKASYENGILLLELPKKKQPEVKKIEIL